MQRPPINTKALIRAVDARGWKYAETARRAGVNVGNLNDIINGKVARPRQRTVRLLAAALGVSEESLQMPRGQDDGRPQTGVADEMELLNLFRQATSGGQEKILIFARGVVAGATAVEIGAAQNLHEKLGQESEKAKRRG
ncbi:MAG TPA: helix-turn-helix domain-containing protein [Phycisphaerae bacterium]|nr:helix-turn-helix domain-containing protein [Phycisphaerae bacterium]